MSPSAAAQAADDRAPLRWLGRLAAILDDPEGIEPGEKLRSFEQLFLIAFVGEYWSRVLLAGIATHPAYTAAAVAATALGVVATRLPLRSACFAGLALVHAAVSASEFPATSNHSFFQIAVCGLAAFLDRGREDEARLYLRALRWMVVVVLFFSGIQKWVHGYWAHADFLAYSLSRESYAAVLGALLPPDELARLSGLDGSLGTGPYRTTAPALEVAANLTWAAEILLAPLLIVRRTRAIALLASLALFTAIEAGAREIFFGLIFASALLSFTRRDVSRWLVGPYAVVVLGLLLTRVGLLPGFVFR